jgi:hypothetical protein
MKELDPATAALFAADPAVTDELASLPEVWARLPVDDDPFRVLAPLLRLCYAAGYCEATRSR